MQLLEYKWEEKIGPVIYIRIKHTRLGLCFCHRMKERSVKFLGLEKYFCARCLGILLGGTFSFLLALVNFRIETWLAFLLMVPMVVDGATQMAFRESNNILRMATGGLFGVGMLFMIVNLIN